MPTRHRLALLTLPFLAWLAPATTQAGEDENWPRLRSMPPEQRQILAENLKKFDALDKPQKAAIRDLDDRIAKLPAENRSNYISVLRRYHLWFQSLPKEQQDALLNAPIEQRFALVKEIRDKERATAPPTAPIFLQLIDLTAPSPFDSAHRLKIWFKLPPEQRAAIEKLPPPERRPHLTELGKKVKVGPPHRLTKAEEEEILKQMQTKSNLKERLTRATEAAPKKAEELRHRFADNYYFIEHPPEAKVTPENLMRFEMGLPSWFRSPFDHLPPEEAKRRLTILYRLVFPAGSEIPASFKPTASVASPSPAPAAPAQSRSKAPAPAPKPGAASSPSPF